MTYELAKQLKEEGYPQIKGQGTFYAESGVFKGAAKSGWIYSPTLEELIEACDGKFYALSFIDDHRGKWVAHDTRVVLQGWGSTPTEAVALLYLALNKK